jgi:hypothetical protein
VLKTSGPALLRRLPEGFGLKHRVQEGQQFAHAGGQGDLGRFACGPQPLVKGVDDRVEPAAGRRQTCQGRLDRLHAQIVDPPERDA